MLEYDFCLLYLFSFLKKYDKITIKTVYFVCSLGNGTSFTLPSVTAGDAGIYICSAKNFDVRSANVTVDVQCKNLLTSLFCLGNLLKQIQHSKILIYRLSCTVY